MRIGYTILEHPADIGIEAVGQNFCEAFEKAAEGLMSIIVDLDTVECTEKRTIVIDAADIEQLVVRWLGEILYLYDGELFLSKKYAIESMSNQHLTATVCGEYLQSAKHTMKLDVKAITYHQLFVGYENAEAVVRVYLDI